MPLVTLIASYFVVWWIVLFAVLPFGVRTQDEAGEVTLGTTRSAPMRPRLVRTVIATTIVSAIIVGGAWWAFDVFRPEPGGDRVLSGGNKKSKAFRPCFIEFRVSTPRRNSPPNRLLGFYR